MENREANIGFFDWWARFYDYDPISLWLRWVQSKVLRQISLSARSSVLDVGCGPGRAILFFKNKGVRNLFGIDLSPLMIQKAKKRLGKNAVLKVASVEKLPFASNKFDIVTNTEAFHHFPNPEKAVREMHRVLKKGGKLYLADMNFFSSIIHWLFKRLEPGHVKIYSKKEFAQLFSKAGFKILEQKRVALFVILTVGEK